MSSSLVATAIDLGLFALLNAWLLPLFMQPVYLTALEADLRVLVATLGARVVSAVVNFKMNEGFVFNLKHCKGAVWRYVLLCVLVAVISGLAVGALTALLPGISATLLKVPVDVTLFLFNYRIQQDWVFKKRMQEEK